MQLDLAQIIKSDGAIRCFDYEFSIVDRDFPDGSRFEEPVLVSGSIKNFSGALLLQISAKTNLSTFCNRCIENITCPVSFSEEFQISMEETEDYNTVEALNGVINLDQVVIENLFLSVPIKRLCSEDCKGLCPTCGANLNKENCNCSKNDFDPRLAALKDLLD
jgi:uncharacterized protein